MATYNSYSFDKFVTDTFVDETTMSNRPNSVVLDDAYTSKSNFANRPNNYQRKAQGILERGMFTGGGVYEEDQGVTSGEVTTQPAVSPVPTRPWWETALGGLFGGFQSVLGLQAQQNQYQYEQSRPQVSPAVYVIIGVLVLLVVVTLLSRK